MSRTKETLSYPEALEILGDTSANMPLRLAAAARVELTLQGCDAVMARDIAFDLLAIVQPEV